MHGKDFNEVPPAGNGDAAQAEIVEAVAQQPHRKLHPVSSAAFELGISERKCWTLIHTGRLRTVWLDQRRLVPDEALNDFISGLPEAKPEMAVAA